MNARKRALLILGLVVGVAFAATLWSRFGGREGDGMLVLYGNVDIREVELAFRVTGRLQMMRFDEGDDVEAGQVVAALDAKPYRDALAAADARVEQARANVAKLEAGSRPQEVERARSAVREAEAAADNAARDFARQTELLTSGASSEKVRDAARARRDATAAQLAAAKEALALAEEGFRAEDVAAARADLAAATAQRELAAH
jgi:HlyD family secretion protein